MGEHKEMAIMAQDAVAGDEASLEAMPKVELTEADLTKMQHRECELMIDTAKTILSGINHRYETYGRQCSKEDIDAAIYWLDRAKLVLE